MLTHRQVDLDGVLRVIVDEVTRRLDADRGTLYLVDHARRELVSRFAHLPEISEIRLRVGEGVAGWVAEHGKLLNVPMGTHDPRFTDRIDALTGYRTNSLLAVPVSSDDTVLAVIQVLNKRSGEFTRRDEHRLTELAGEVAELLNSTSLASMLVPGQQHPLFFRFNHIVGDSPAMHEVYDRTERAAATAATVLVRGETGTGKELIARAVHYNSTRRDQPFVKVDCAALPESLIENELFGHERGAFTGADRASDGKVQAANGGTLFLDEIGELSLATQGKLLRLLQERTFLKVGGNTPETADVRFVCATHRDLEDLVAKASFRQDLYYRLRVVEIFLPPLRRRGSADLDRLVDHFLYRYSRHHDRPGMTLSDGARGALHNHDWPGNVRELEHCIESAVVLSPEPVVQPAALPITRRGHPEGAAATHDGEFYTGVRALRDVELDYIRYVLDSCDGNRSQAARVLGIGRNTLNRKLS
jgi:Nif-specific regulatory protein